MLRYLTSEPPNFGTSNAHLHICTLTCIQKEYFAVPKATLEYSHQNIIVYKIRKQFSTKNQNLEI